LIALQPRPFHDIIVSDVKAPRPKRICIDIREAKPGSMASRPIEIDDSHLLSFATQHMSMRLPDTVRGVVHPDIPIEATRYPFALPQEIENLSVSCHEDFVQERWI